MKPILEIHHLAKKYRIKHFSGGYLSLRERLLNFKSKSKVEDFWAVNDVSFQVDPGESIGIIGRNGAGKSTLLKILSKITPPTKGKIISRGRMASLLEVGTGFHPELTGRENIFFNGSLLGMKRREIELKFDEIVDFSGVEKFLDTPLKHYSSGMQLRLAFSVAAFLEPEILIIDEVLAVGDAEFQKKCIGKMEDVSKSGRTILFVSHNMGAIKNLCDKAILLDRGAISSIGGVDSVTAKYMSFGSSNAGQLLTKPENSPMWIERVSINKTQSRADLYYGDRVEINVECRSELTTQAFIGFVILSLDGTAIANGNNRYQKYPLNIVPGQPHTITCDLGMVPLMEGSYAVNLYFGDENKDYHIVENSIVFDVHERDIWGNGNLPPLRSSNLWWDTRFEISSEKNNSL
jgi:lipopolysaccharide transport system ATP-binding protein